MNRRNKILVIFGGSGIGRIAAEIAYYVGYRDVVFLNDREPVGQKIGMTFPTMVVGETGDYREWMKRRADFFFAYVGLGSEQETYSKLSMIDIPDDRFPNLIHPSAMVSVFAERMEYGVLIGPGAVVGPDTIMEKHTKLLAGAYLGHNSVMREHAHAAANSVIGADVLVDRGCHIGTNAVIREKTIIGEFSLVGCGAVVVKDVSPGSVVVGNPAKPLRG